MGLNMGGVFTVHKYAIKVPGENKPVYIVPFGDIHWGSPNFAKDKWLEFINERKGCPNTYYLGMGDYTDLASFSEREKIRQLHDSSIDLLERVHMNLLDEFCESIAHCQGKVIGFIQGNHDMEFMDGTTGTQRLAQRFRTKYLGCSTLTRIAFEVNGSRSKIDIHAHHGQGGGARLKGGSLNRVQYMAEAVLADIYLMGHDHQKGCVSDTRLELLQTSRGGLVVRDKQVWYGRTGSFLKGYEDGKASYIADRAKKGTDLGGIMFDVRFVRKDTKDGPRELKTRIRCIQ